MRPFLVALRKTRSVTHACKAVRRGRQTVYANRKLDERFAKAWDAIFESITDDLEASLVTRAIRGTKRPVYFGPTIGLKYVREFNDSVGLKLLGQRRPHVYNRSSGDVGDAVSPHDTALAIQEAMRLLDESVAVVPDSIGPADTALDGGRTAAPDG